MIVRIAAIVLAAQALFAGEVKTLPMPGLRNPYGLCEAPDRALYICDIDNHVIWRWKDGSARIVAGSGKRGYSGDGGPATKAELNEPYEVRFDGDGNMIFVEMQNHLIRRVNAKDETISTIGGSGQPGFFGDGGPALNARFNQPHSLQLNTKGDLYVCDIGNHRIRRIDRAGSIDTCAGTGEIKATKDGGRFSTEPLNGPRAMDFAADGAMWLALREGNAIYRLTLDGIIHHAAGTGAKGKMDGPARSATLSGPKGISLDPRGDVYFADTESHSVRVLRLKTGVVETVVGTGERGDGPDGPPLKCALARPHGVFVSKDGILYIGDSENNKVRVLRLN